MEVKLKYCIEKEETFLMTAEEYMNLRADLNHGNYFPSYATNRKIEVVNRNTENNNVSR